MRLYIMRHGHAPSAAEAGVSSDQERPLSGEGRAEARRAAERLMKSGARPGLILASPLKRAQQTAEEAAGAIAPRPEVRVFPPLANQISGQELHRRLVEDPPQASEVLLVGHMPQLGDLASSLVGGFHPLRTAGLVAVELDGGGRARLLWSSAQ